MGQINYQLVPAAVLLDNPGITLEKYVQKLNLVNSGKPFKSKCIRSNIFNGFYDYVSSDSFHEGILRVGKSFLNLPIKNPKEHFIPKGDTTGRSGLQILVSYEDKSFGNPKYRVITDFGSKYKTEEFDSLNSLIKKYSKYDPENVFDFPENGKLWTGQETARGRPFCDLKWYRKEKSFFLDVDDMLRKGLEYEYTSTILTAEAIKHKEWEILGFLSGDEIEGAVSQFFLNHFDSFKRHRNSIVKFEDVRNAFLEERTFTEWMEKRSEMPWSRGLSKKQLLAEFEIEKAEAQEKIERMNRRREYDRKAFKELSSPMNPNEIPF